jgi:rhodanese-related sulfurtransferase
VAHWLRAQGYDAHNVDGGMEAWAVLGLPVEGRSA